jgi:hypothetical protein
VILVRNAPAIVLLVTITPLFAQSPPVSSDQPWHSIEERQIMRDTRSSYAVSVRIEPDKIYSLAELIDFAEAHNPETRVAWESARAQAAALGIARSELFPTLAAVSLASVERKEDGFGSRFYRQTLTQFEISLDFTYTIFDFGARRGRINAESARLLASNFGFNDVHRQLIYNVSQAYYRLLNAAGQTRSRNAISAGVGSSGATELKPNAPSRLSPVVRGTIIWVLIPNSSRARLTNFGQRVSDWIEITSGCWFCHTQPAGSSSTGRRRFAMTGLPGAFRI